MKRWLAGLLLLLLPILSGGCDKLPALPENPFRATPTIVEEEPSRSLPPIVGPTLTPLPTAVTFAPYWVKNHRSTEMWSGPAGQPGVVSFGTTSRQFCAFQVERPQEGGRLYVLNPFSQNYFWIDADAVGPVSEAPTRATGPKPADQNCGDQLYDG
jgi:hypothetical protein